MKKSKEIFIEKAKLIYGDLFDYSLFEYQGWNIKSKIICKKHGIFEKSPTYHLLGIKYSGGCPKCGIENRNIKVAKIKQTSFNEFVKKANCIHSNKYDYSNVSLGNYHQKIKIICPIHGEWTTTPMVHINGKSGCPKCSIIKRGENKKIRTAKKFFQIVAKTNLDYSKSIYKGINKPIIITCKKHGEFLQTPEIHLKTLSCPRCSRSYKSNLSQEWLDFLNIPLENREVNLVINNKKIKVDAFCSNTNTVYEFLGDYWHGNPKIYNSFEFNQNNKKTFGELFNNTLNRLNLIKEKYNLVYIWENDWLLYKTKNYIK